MGVHHARGSLADEAAAIALGDERDETPGGGANPGSEIGQHLNLALPEGGAVGSQRTDDTTGLAWRADERAEFHQRLVKLRAGASLQHQGLGQTPKSEICLLCPRVTADSEYASQYADDVAIQNRFRLVKGDATNRSSRVPANSRQGQQVIKILRKLALVIADNNSRRLLHVPNAGV